MALLLGHQREMILGTEQAHRLMGIIKSRGAKSHNVTIGFDNLQSNDTTKFAGEFSRDAGHFNRIG